jgi:glycine C-acetyltransferase
MSQKTYERLRAELRSIEADGLYKRERIITSPQSGVIRVARAGAEQPIINLCANNYLGLADHPEIIAAAKAALDDYGYGMASVRFICGTQDLHKRLEQALARFLGTDDAILYTSCFDANGGLFETLLEEGDAVLSDALNHASIIDGIRLCKASRYRYAHADMDDLEAKLKEAAGARLRLIATDGVFSMDGDIAPLDRIVELARAHDALVMVDDSHATVLDRADHAVRCAAGAGDGRRPAGRGHLRDRLLLSGGAGWAGTHPRADLGRARARPPGPGDLGVHPRRPATRRHRVADSYRSQYSLSAANPSAASAQSIPE